MSFDGFISYSHAADGRLAPAIQRGLHRLAKPWHQRRALWIFRDQTGLAVTPKLWTSIQQALDGSKYFVLLASPAAAGSQWVNREIHHWLTTKSADRILPVVTEGEWRWDPQARDFTADSTAVPAALRGVFAEEPLFLDLRWARDDLHLSLQHSRFRDAIAQLAAPMHGLSKDELEGEDVRQHRRARRLTAVAAAALVLLTVVASLTGVVAVRNADRATAAAVEARQQQQLAAQQRQNAESASAESLRQQQNARTEGDKAKAAAAETRRQEQLAGYHQALARDASAEAKKQQTLAGAAADEAKREQANATRYRANADRQQANATRQQALARGAADDAKRQQADAELQKANAARQAAEARRQQTLADRATARAKEQERLAQYHRDLAKQAEEKRKEQEQLAAEAKQEAERQRQIAERQQKVEVSRRLIGRARKLITDDPKQALMLGAAAQRLHPDPQTREQLAHLTMSTRYAGALNDAVDVGALAGQMVAVAEPGGKVSLWSTAEPARPARIAQLAAGGTTDKKLAVDPGGRTLAVSDGTPDAAVWNVTDPAHPVREATLSDPAGIRTVALSGDGRTVATSNRENNTTLWDVTGAAPAKLSTLTAAYPLTFSPDGRTAVTSGATARVWDLTDPAKPVEGATLVDFEGKSMADAMIAYNPKLPVVALQTGPGYADLWNFANPAKPRRSGWTGPGGSGPEFSSMAFSPDGRTLALADTDGTTTLRGLAEGGTFSDDGSTYWMVSTEEARLTALGSPVRSLAFSPDGRTLTTVGNRSIATLWYPKGRFPQTPTADLPGPYPGTITGLAFRPDSRSLIAAGYGGEALPFDLTDPAGPKKLSRLPLHSTKVEGMSLSGDGRTMATFGRGAITLIDMTPASGPAHMVTLKRDGVVPRTVAFSPDGNTVAIGLYEGKVILFDLTDRQKPAKLTEFAVREALVAITFTPDGKTMAIGEGDSISLWSMANRSAPARLTSFPVGSSFTASAQSIAFSPDGRLLVSTEDRDLEPALWNVADPAQPSRIGTLTGHVNVAKWVGFSPDGRTVATVSVGGSIALWDVAEPATPVQFAMFTAVGMQNFRSAFSPDGRWLANGGDPSSNPPPQKVTLWDTSLPQGVAADPVAAACDVTGRGLNEDEWEFLIPELDHRATC